MLTWPHYTINKVCMQEYNIVEVTCKATKDRIKIKGYKFNSEIHAEPIVKVGEVGKSVDGGAVDLSYLSDIADKASAEPKEEPKEEAAKIVCEACDGKEFKREQDLKTHNRKFHTE